MSSRFTYRAEACAMRSEGQSIRAIARHFGVSDSTIHRVTDEATHERQIALARRRYARDHKTSELGAGPDCGFVAKHVYRTPRQLIDRDAIRKILAERNGSIPIDSLMVLVSAP